MKIIAVFLISLFVLIISLGACRSVFESPSSEVLTPIETLSSTKIPTPESVQPGELKVRWKSFGPEEANWIDAVVVDDVSSTIYAIGALTPERIYHKDVWENNYGSQSWKYLGIIDKLEIDFKEKLKIAYKESLRGAIDTSGSLNLCGNEYLIPEYGSLDVKKRDPNNPEIILLPVYRDIDFVFPEADPPTSLVFTDAKFLLSFDGGKSWSVVNLPREYQLGVYKFVPRSILINWSCYDLISYGETLNIFCSFGKLYQAEIDLKSIK